MKGSVFISFFLALLLLACAKPVPTENALYVGAWSGSGATLAIQPEGRVDYHKVEGNSTTTVSGPISKWEGPHFSVGISVLSKRFTVSKPPYRAGLQWKMVVDGVELARSPTESEMAKFPPEPAPLPVSAPNSEGLSSGNEPSLPGSHIFKVQKSIYSANESIVIEFSGLPGNQQDWITVVGAAEPEHVYKEWYYLQGKREGSITFRNPGSGSHEARLYFDWPTGSYKVQDRAGFVVK